MSGGKRTDGEDLTQRSPQFVLDKLFALFTSLVILLNVFELNERSEKKKS